jgi:hypothetical protein
MVAEMPRGSVVVISPDRSAASGRFEPGRQKTGGKKHRSPNKLPSQIKEMIVKALEECGGVDYLVTQAFLEPKAFLALLSRVLPLQIAGDPNGAPIKIERTIKRVLVRPGDAAAMSPDAHASTEDDDLGED